MDDRAQLLQGIRGESNAELELKRRKEREREREREREPYNLSGSGGIQLRKVVTNDKSAPRIDVSECKPINNNVQYPDDVISATPAMSGGQAGQDMRGWSFSFK